MKTYRATTARVLTLGAAFALALAVEGLALQNQQRSTAEDWRTSSFQGRVAISNPMQTGAPQGANCTYEVSKFGELSNQRGQPRIEGRLICPSARKRFTADMQGTLVGCALEDPDRRGWSWSELGFSQGMVATVQTRSDGSLSFQLASSKIRGCSASFLLPAVKELTSPQSGKPSMTNWASNQASWSSVSFRARHVQLEGDTYTAEIVPLGRNNQVEVRLFDRNGNLWRRGEGQIGGLTMILPQLEGQVDEDTPFRPAEFLGFDARSPTSAQLMADGSVKFLMSSSKDPRVTLEALLPATR